MATKTIYVVYSQFYDDFEIEKAFESREQAKAYIDEMKKVELIKYDYAEIELVEED